MHTITIASGKGGVGKTVVAASVGAMLSRAYETTDPPYRRARVLLLDLDLYIKGLTYLMYPRLEVLRQLPVCVLDFLVFAGHESSPNPTSELERLLSAWDKSLVTLPASIQLEETDGPTPPESWASGAVVEGLSLMLDVARQSGADFTIIDTRAGPDVLSLSATLLSDVTWLVLEQDRISWRSSLNFLLQRRSFEDTVRPEFRPHPARRRGAEFLFLPNKSPRRVTAELSKVLSSYDFLPAIPLDTYFFKRYVSDPFEAVTMESLTTCRFGSGVQAALVRWMELSGLRYEYKDWYAGGGIRPSKLIQRFYARPERLLPLLGFAAIALKWSLMVPLGISDLLGMDLVATMMSDLLLLLILVLLGARSSRD